VMQGREKIRPPDQVDIRAGTIFFDNSDDIFDSYHQAKLFLMNSNEIGPIKSTLFP